MLDKIIKEKVEQSIGILKDKNIDMWLIFARESSTVHDPMMDMVVGKNCTWHSAFIFCKDGDTAAIVGSIEESNFTELECFKEVIGYVQSVKEPLLEYLKKKNPEQIAINFSVNSSLADGLSHGMYITLREYLMEIGMENRLISAEEIVSSVKGRKSPSELAIMKEAITETLRIFDEVTKFIKPGKTEKEISDFTKQFVFDKGFGLAWDEDHCPAVFTGPDTAGAHSGPTDKRVEKGHIVNMDFGILYKGYCSDLQRMWYVLKDDETDAPEEVKKGFNIIKDAIRMSAAKLKPGMTGCEIDDIARNYITENGYEEYPHGLGHQVGRQVHDGGAGLFPRWERYGNAPFMKLEKNQIFTIEPRLPVAGYGTSTLEEMVYLTEDGCEFISTPQEELMLIR
ncbi:MAG TPA: M24 family metallopeptidase [Ignavibacteriaceae bacterium]|nr:M24 family metallopeptidase [Ignavibacteriaceae bacterium]